jgi:hypothetical protein
MVHMGHERAQQFSRDAWCSRLASALERKLERDERSAGPLLEVRRRVAERVVGVGTTTLLAPVQVRNWGAGPAPSDGPGRVVLCSSVREVVSGDVAGPRERTALPRLLIPGDEVAAAVTVTVPERCGTYEVLFWAEPVQAAGSLDQRPPDRYTSSMRLIVSANERRRDGCCGELLDNLRPDLDEAERLQHLPDDYLDVTQGALAAVKRRIKHKLLNNLKTAYVDVMSRQQSAFNRQVLSVIQELVRCCELLDHAVGQRRQRRRRKEKKNRKREEMP